VRLRRAAFRALALVGGEASLPAIERALRDEDPVVRINAIHGLARIPTEKATALGTALLASEDPWTRRTAAVALDAMKAIRR
jgi:HEAT repeat protein